jgi:iron complex transport system substrate-binding protein
MPAKQQRFLIWLWLTLIVTVLVPLVAWAAPPPQEQNVCIEEYTVQADDWLSKIAAKFLGDTLAYPAIVTATNQEQAQDSSFAQITDPDLIEVGWKICIPAAEEAQAMLPAAEMMGDQVMVTDALGRVVEFAELPQRVVIAGRATPLIVDAFYLFPEARQALTGIELRSQSAKAFLSVIDPTYESKTALEMNSGPEQIAPLQPEAVLLKSFMAEQLGTPLEQLQIPVVYLDLETPEQYVRDITTMGQLLGAPARAQEILDFYQQRVDLVEGAMAGLADDQKPRVLLLQYSDSSGEVAFNVAPAAWLQTTMVELAGGVPVWTEAAEQGGWAVVNLEQIAAWDPDQIYVVSYFTNPEEVVAQLKADSTWQALAAVQNDQLFGFPNDFVSWDQPDPRWILGLQWLATKIQPERAAGIDMKQAVNEFYGQMYGLDQSTIDTQVSPIIKGM